ncbi:MAG: hypothetical protein BGO54_11675 [Sphingobacteriales bacterium 46-32]|nr:MAG: hypothetical protein BGO54_11675 [Sphingobacteriales bacterium 46-32]
MRCGQGGCKRWKVKKTVGPHCDAGLVHGKRQKVKKTVGPHCDAGMEDGKRQKVKKTVGRIAMRAGCMAKGGRLRKL